MTDEMKVKPVLASACHVLYALRRVADLVLVDVEPFDK